MVVAIFRAGICFFLCLSLLPCTLILPLSVLSFFSLAVLLFRFITETQPAARRISRYTFVVGVPEPINRECHRSAPSCKDHGTAASANAVYSHKCGPKAMQERGQRIVHMTERPLRSFPPSLLGKNLKGRHRTFPSPLPRRRVAPSRAPSLDLPVIVSLLQWHLSVSVTCCTTAVIRHSSSQKK